MGITLENNDFLIIQYSYCVFLNINGLPLPQTLESIWPI